MRRRKRKQNKMILISFIFLLFLFSVGYSSFSSDFLINGKGTIVEKGIDIGGVNVKLVTTGSGLYESEYEAGRYIYRGLSPDNYIKLGSDMYRIISKETEGSLKVIKNESIGRKPFDLGYSTNIDGVTSSSSTEGTRYSSNSTDYCYASSSSSYSGCKVWGSKATMLDNEGNNVTIMPWEIGETEYNLPETESYLNTYLNTTWYNSLSSEVQNVIITYLFNVGLVDRKETNLATSLATEKAYKWRGKVGLANVSDYVLANTNESCTEGVKSHNSIPNCYDTNRTDNWLHIKRSTFFPCLIAPFSNSFSGSVWQVYPAETFLTGAGAAMERDIFPVLYLKSDIKLTGTGKQDDPFILVN